MPGSMYVVSLARCKMKLHTCRSLGHTAQLFTFLCTHIKQYARSMWVNVIRDLWNLVRQVGGQLSAAAHEPAGYP